MNFSTIRKQEIISITNCLLTSYIARLRSFPFNKKRIRRLSLNISIINKQRKSASEWLNLLESGLLEKEKQNYIRFSLFVLQDILGYDIRKKLDYEKENKEFSFRGIDNQGGVCIEVKGMSTKDLFSSQHREKIEHETPIKQT